MKVGDKVTIKLGSDYSSQNPTKDGKKIPGKIYKEEKHAITGHKWRVEFPNGYENVYRDKDLELVTTEPTTTTTEEELDTMAKSTELERDATVKKVIVPQGMALSTAIEFLQRKQREEEKEISITETISCFPFDGALALQKAMLKVYGYADAVDIISSGFFGKSKTPPQMISIEVGVNKTVNVPWGRFELPNIEGYIETGMTRKNGKVVFAIKALTLKKHEPAINELVELTRQLSQTESIYKGKALSVRFKDDSGDDLDIPTPKFLDLSRVKEDELIFSHDVQRAIETSLFTPIEHSAECRAAGIPLKRGILLSGPFGVGKTLAAYVSAKKCEKAGWTFLYCERADELPDMVKFAMQYGPAVIFCEDIDRVIQGERSIAMDEILNIVDGIESKASEVMIVLTTNNVDAINQAMLRPGRLDAVINVLPPDALAVERLLRLYGRGLIDDAEDITEAALELEGQIPAVIRECIERAKLSAISLRPENTQLVIDGTSVMDAAITMRNQLDLLSRKRDEKPDTLALLAHELARPSIKAMQSVKEAVENINS